MTEMQEFTLKSNGFKPINLLGNEYYKFKELEVWGRADTSLCLLVGNVEFKNVTLKEILSIKEIYERS